MNILYCRIGWCKYYNGNPKDPPINGGSYTKNNVGHEIHNFLNQNGVYYGYVETQSINALSRFDNFKNNYADNVLVIWYATKPISGGQYVVGWYENAKVYINRQIVPPSAMQERILKDHKDYIISSQKAYLIDEKNRNCLLNKSGGRNALWYGEPSTNEQVLNYIRNIDNEYKDRIEVIEKDIKTFEGGEKEVLVNVRINQDKYRNQLLERYKMCCIHGCGINKAELLIASHIKPWAVSDNKEKLDPGNGLLLCPNHDKLFDSGYISFDDNGKILISRKLDEFNRKFLNVNENMEINISDDNIAYLVYHRKYVFKN